MQEIKWRRIKIRSFLFSRSAILAAMLSLDYHRNAACPQRCFQTNKNPTMSKTQRSPIVMDLGVFTVCASPAICSTQSDQLPGRSWGSRCACQSAGPTPSCEARYSQVEGAWSNLWSINLVYKLTHHVQSCKQHWWPAACQDWPTPAELLQKIKPTHSDIKAVLYRPPGSSGTPVCLSGRFCARHSLGSHLSPSKPPM